MQAITLKNFPYLSQRDNEFNPSGACNVTSVAMCLKYFGIKGDDSYPQLEDQAYQKCLDNNWSRHDPLGLKALIESYPGMKDDFTSSGTLEDIKQAISAGIPCILHGYFTRSGHIIVAYGFDDQGLIVNDPWGEWFESGYEDSSGENLHYSWGMISRLCSPESTTEPKDIWLHRVHK